LFDPVGETNALHSENHVPQSPEETIGLARTRRIVSTLLDGPDYIKVRRNKRDYKKISPFDRELKIMRTQPNKVQESWAIYADGDRIPGAVLRYAKLENGAMQEARTNSTLPHMTIITRYVAQEYYEKISSLCNELDALLLAGNVPQPATHSNDPWRFFTLIRRAEVFSIELNWNALSISPELETSMFNLGAKIEEILREHKQRRPRRIDRLEFVYNNPKPDVIKVLAGES
jgi:hypothetical protein